MIVRNVICPSVAVVDGVALLRLDRQLYLYDAKKKVKLLDEQGLSYAGTYIYHDQVFIVSQCRCSKKHHINQ